MPSEKPVDPAAEPAAGAAADLPQGTPVEAPEVIAVTSLRVACDGGEGALGHPRVWLQIPEDRGWVECGYCDRRYVLEGAPDPAHGAHGSKGTGFPDEA